MSEIERTSPNSARSTATYEREPGATLDAVERAIASLPKWTLESRTENGLHAVRVTAMLRFKDDVRVTAEPDDEPGRTRLTLESASRLGRSDFGQNHRNLRELLDALERELNAQA